MVHARFPWCGALRARMYATGRRSSCGVSDGGCDKAHGTARLCVRGAARVQRLVVGAVVETTVKCGHAEDMAEDERPTQRGARLPLHVAFLSMSPSSP
eukprot:4573965-Prymnesium_polylepis.1